MLVVASPSRVLLSVLTDKYVDWAESKFAADEVSNVWLEDVRSITKQLL